MKLRFRDCLSSFILIAAAIIAPVSVAYGQSDGAAANQSDCDYNENISKGPAVPGPSQADPPYFMWKPLGRGDQRIASACPQCLVQHSGLYPWEGESVTDEAFAQMLSNQLSPQYENTSLVFVFVECFGGGMIDDLASHFGSGNSEESADRVVFDNPVSIITAAFFNQRAWYPIDSSNGGNGTDFLWSYIRALRKPGVTAQQAAAQAVSNDPFGWNPKPDPPRSGKETMGKETAEYYSRKNGDNITFDPSRPSRIILWAGKPEKMDDEQLNILLRQLLALGYNKEDILVLFADGKPKDGYLLQTMKKVYGNGNGQNHLKEADKKQLDLALGWAFPVNTTKIKPPQFVFFLSADHGCNNAFKPESGLKLGNGEGPIQGGGSWGGGDNNTPPN